MIAMTDITTTRVQEHASTSLILDMVAMITASRVKQYVCPSHKSVRSPMFLYQVQMLIFITNNNSYFIIANDCEMDFR